MKKTKLPLDKVLFKTGYVLMMLIIEQFSLLISLFIIYKNTYLHITFQHYLYILPVMLISSIILYDFFKLSTFHKKPLISILEDCFKFVFCFFAIICIYAYLLNLYAFSRYALVLGSIIFYVLLNVFTILTQKVSLRLYGKNSMLVISSQEQEANSIISKINCEAKELNLDIIGWLKPDEFLENNQNLKLPSEVLITSSVDEKVKFDLLVLCSKYNIKVYIVPTFYDLSFSKYKIIKFYDTPSFLVENEGLTFQQKLLKRVFDLFFSILVLILTSPVFLILSIIIKLDSKGPVFYLQDRLTYNGKVYKVIKFRTMISDAEKIFGAYQSVGKDPRVTRFGAFLRNTHLDELPQFVNVLLGSISVVGPRSDRTITIDIMDQQATGYSYRLKVKAGITGMAQLMGKYNSDPADKLRYDVFYIKNYSLLLDVQLIFMTIFAMIPRPSNEEVIKDKSDYFIKHK